jgi:cyclopropane-fatty-acyl-phospholipid synthase
VRADVAAGQSFTDEVVAASSGTFDRWLLGRIQRPMATAPIRYRLWDGYELSPPADPPIATIEIKNRRALVGWARDPELNFGEAYMFGAVEVHGDLEGMLEAVYRAFGPSTRRGWWQRQMAHTVEASRQNVHHHYDLGNDFYKLWLDEQLLYTCAYFPTPDATLEAAQIAKMDLVCRKIRLQPGERVVEAGCGWGALALHMARHYGARVQAFNLSTNQIAYARERAAREGLADRVEFVEDDYRNVSGTFDAFVSVGMLEHVGLENYGDLGRVIDRTMGADGRGLLHFIGRNKPEPLNAWIVRRIFPGAYPPTLREVCDGVLEPQALSVLDVENLRLHYAKTIEHWRHRFDASAESVREMADEQFERAWRLYLAGSQAAFVTGSMQLFQVVFARGGTNRIPWTRVEGLTT